MLIAFITLFLLWRTTINHLHKVSIIPNGFSDTIDIPFILKILMMILMSEVAIDA